MGHGEIALQLAQFSAALVVLIIRRMLSGRNRESIPVTIRYKAEWRVHLFRWPYETYRNPYTGMAPACEPTH